MTRLPLDLSEFLSAPIRSLDLGFMRRTIAGNAGPSDGRRASIFLGPGRHAKDLSEVGVELARSVWSAGTGRAFARCSDGLPEPGPDDRLLRAVMRKPKLKTAWQTRGLHQCSPRKNCGSFQDQTRCGA